MAKFKITDNQSGKTLVISGDSPPTDQEAEQLFQQSGIRGMTGSQALAKQVPLNQPIPENPPTDNPFAPLAQFLNPNVIKYSQNALQQIGQGNLTPTKPNVTQALAPLGGPLGNLLFGVPNQQAAGMELASDVQGAKAIAGGVGGAINTVGNMGKGIMGAKSINPIKIMGYLRDQAVNKAGNVSTKGLIKAGDQFVADNPLAQDIWDTFKPTITKKMPASDLLRKMTQVFGNAYTKTGDVRVDAGSGLMNQLYQAGKTVMKEQAPEVAKYTSGMRQAITAPKNIQKVATLLAKLGLAKGIIGGGL